MELRNQLKDITLDDISPQNIQTVGGRVFADARSRNNMDDLVHLVKGWQIVHSPSYGQSIPQSGEFLSATVADTPSGLVRPTGNEVYRVVCLEAQNATLGTLTATVEAGDPNYPTTDASVVLVSQDIAAGSTVNIPIPSNLLFDSKAQLFVKASGASLEFTAYVQKVVQ